MSKEFRELPEPLDEDDTEFRMVMGMINEDSLLVGLPEAQKWAVWHLVNRASELTYQQANDSAQRSVARAVAMTLKLYSHGALTWDDEGAKK